MENFVKNTFEYEFGKVYMIEQLRIIIEKKIASKNATLLWSTYLHDL